MKSREMKKKKKITEKRKWSKSSNQNQKKGILPDEVEKQRAKLRRWERDREGLKKKKKRKKKNKNTSKFRHWEDEKGKKKYFKGTHEVRPREWGRESEGYLKRMSLSWVR